MRYCIPNTRFVWSHWEELMRSKKLSILLATVLAWSTAQADEMNALGGSCVPDDLAITNNRYANQFNPQPEITWKSGASGTLTLFCPIPVELPNPNAVEFYYSNNTSCTGCSGDYITVTYKRMHKTTGVVSTVAALSTVGATNDGTFQGISTSFSDTWNSNTYTYFVQVDMIRGTTSNFQKLYGVVVYESGGS